MSGIPGFAVPMFIIVVAIVFVFIIFGVVLIYKFPKKINRSWDYVIGLFILGSYSFVFLETLSNSNFNNHFTQLHLPWYNFIGFLLIIGSIAIMLPRRFKIRQYLLALIVLMSTGFMYGMVDNIIDYINSYKTYFCEKSFWYIFSQAVLIIYSLYSIRSGDTKVNFKTILFSIVFMLSLYGISLVVNLNSSLSIFGVGKYFINLIKYTDTLSCIFDFLSILIFIITSYLLFIFPFKKYNQKEPV